MTVTLERQVLPATIAEGTYNVLTGHRWSEYDSLNNGHAVPLVGENYSWSAVRPLHSGEADLYTIDATSWGDYSYGPSDYQRSNYRSLLRDYPDTFVEVGFSSHDGMVLALPAYRAIDPFLADILIGLGEYPLYDEEDHSTLSEEVWQEGWEWRTGEIRQDLERVEFTYEDSRMVVSDDWIQRSYDSHRDVAHWGLIMDGADSAYIDRQDHERIMAEVVKDYRVVILNYLLRR